MADGLERVYAVFVLKERSKTYPTFKVAPADITRVNVHDAREVARWSDIWGVTVDEVRGAVDIVGRDPMRVEKFFSLCAVRGHS